MIAIHRSLLLTELGISTSVSSEVDSPNSSFNLGSLPFFFFFFLRLFCIGLCSKETCDFCEYLLNVLGYLLVQLVVFNCIILSDFYVTISYSVVLHNFSHCSVLRSVPVSDTTGNGHPKVKCLHTEDNSSFSV